MHSTSFRRAQHRIMVPWSLVSPASRGIGFALVRHILKTTKSACVATTRKDVNKTKGELVAGLDVDSERLTVLKLDVLDEKSIADAAEACRKKSGCSLNQHHLHLAFILPGLLFPERSPAQVDAENALLTFRTNTLGPLLMLKHFESFLPRKNIDVKKQVGASSSMCTNLPSTSTVAVMSARVGSISDNRLGGWYSYRASKAGVNQVVKTFDNHLKAVSGDKAIALGMHPGTVKTGLSKEFWGNVPKEKLFDSEWVAERLVQVVKDVGVQGRGKCWAWDGKEVPP